MREPVWPSNLHWQQCSCALTLRVLLAGLLATSFKVEVKPRHDRVHQHQHQHHHSLSHTTSQSQQPWKPRSIIRPMQASLWAIAAKLNRPKPVILLPSLAHCRPKACVASSLLAYPISIIFFVNLCCIIFISSFLCPPSSIYTQP